MINIMDIRKKLEQAQKFCNAKRIPYVYKEKVRQYYTLQSDILMLVKYYNLFQAMPDSLRTELSLALNKELISKVNIFNLGSPAFIQSIAK